jgi:hypothetical protein
MGGRAVRAHEQESIQLTGSPEARQGVSHRAAMRHQGAGLGHDVPAVHVHDQLSIVGRLMQHWS